MGDYLRLLTVNDRDIPWLRCSAPSRMLHLVSRSSGRSGQLSGHRARTRRSPGRLGDHRAQPSGPNTLGAEEVAEFIDSLDAGGPPSAVRWLADYLETIRAIYAIRIYPEAIVGKPEAEDAVYSVRSALRAAVGGIGQWDGHGFTNEDDRLIWCDPRMVLKGKTEAAIKMSPQESGSRSN